MKQQRLTVLCPDISAQRETAMLSCTNVVESNVYPFAKTDRGEKLCKLTSDAIKEMKEDGTLKELSEKWFDTDITVKPEGSEDLK